MESRETVSGGEDNVVEGKYFTHEETFPKDMINIPVGKGPMLTRCAAARSPRLAAQRGRFRVPQLTQWVVQISHLRCSLGRDSLRNRDHNLRSGLYRNRSFGVLWGDAWVPRFVLWAVQVSHLWGFRGELEWMQGLVTGGVGFVSEVGGVYAVDEDAD